MRHLSPESWSTSGLREWWYVARRLLPCEGGSGEPRVRIAQALISLILICDAVEATVIRVHNRLFWISTANGWGPSPERSGRSSAWTTMLPENSTEGVLVGKPSNSWARCRTTPIVNDMCGDSRDVGRRGGVKFDPWLNLASVTLTTEPNGPRNIWCSSLTCTTSAHKQHKQFYAS